jgi:putative tricarboxylic transport membrane protein
LVTITRHLPNLIRSSIVGAFIGALPGTGGVTSAFTAYSISKGRAKPNEKYGEGEPGGIVATESANNATCGGVMIPTLSLGIPGDASSAILMSVLLILGFFPGPQLFNSSPEIVSGIFYVYILSNIFLLAVGIFLAPLFASILRLREARLFPIVLLSCAIGTFAVQYSVFDLWAMLGFGVLGTLMRAANYPLAPVVIGVVLGPIAELNIRKSLLLSDTGFFIFIQRPISFCIIVIAVLILGWLTFDKYKKAKQ